MVGWYIPHDMPHSHSVAHGRHHGMLLIAVKRSRAEGTETPVSRFDNLSQLSDG